MKRILFCVLNWGLGHATRSSPLIANLISRGYPIKIASDGIALKFLRDRFPEGEFIELPSYRIRYPYETFLLNIPGISMSVQSAISKEKKMIDLLVQTWEPEVIISDNRYGCYHKSALSVIITHQFQLIEQGKWLNFLFKKIIANKLKPFHQIWVPDYSGADKLSGRLSDIKSNKLYFIGPLSHIKIESIHTKTNHVLFLLSGPEPARSKLEDLIFHLQPNPNYTYELIRGVQPIRKDLARKTRIHTINLATSEQVSNAIQSADIVVCRSGYSTIMDLSALGKPAIFIPTPGQPEQLYLANRMAELNRGVVIQQQEFHAKSLNYAIEQLRKFTQFPAPSHPDLNARIECIIDSANKE